MKNLLLITGILLSISTFAQDKKHSLFNLNLKPDTNSVEFKREKVLKLLEQKMKEVKQPNKQHVRKEENKNLTSKN